MCTRSAPRRTRKQAARERAAFKRTCSIVACFTFTWRWRVSLLSAIAFLYRRTARYTARVRACIVQAHSAQRRASAAPRARRLRRSASGNTTTLTELSTPLRSPHSCMNEFMASAHTHAHIYTHTGSIALSLNVCSHTHILVISVQETQARADY